MKKTVALIVTMLIVVNTLTPVQAISTSTSKRVRYEKPIYNIMDDSGQSYDILGTLRMSVPDVIFEENLKIIKEVMKGNREKYLDYDDFKHISFQYKCGLHLLPLQMKAYTMTSNAMGVTDPITASLARQLPNGAMGVNQLYMLTLGNYRELGYMSMVE